VKRGAMRQARPVAMRMMERILMRVCAVGGREDMVFVVGNDSVMLGCSILEIEVRLEGLGGLERFSFGTFLGQLCCC
jgi:hypothetical protein